MPTLVIGNMDNEYMIGEPWKLSTEMRRRIGFLASRWLWLADEGDAVLLPCRVSAEFLEYSARLRGLDPRSLTVLVPPGGEDDVVLLTFAVLKDARVLDAVRSLTGRGGDWRVDPFCFDRAIAWLVAQAGLWAEPGMLAYCRHGGAEQLNSKAEFHRIAARHGVPVAEAAVCSSAAELAVALGHLLEVTGAAIVKQDLNAGGAGNVVVTRSPGVEVGLGAAETLRIASDVGPAALADRLWRQLTGERNVQLVAEVFHPASTSYYTELEAPPDGRRPRLLNFGEMRMDPAWVGFEIPCRLLTPCQLAELASASTTLADVARTRGYVGKINCDAIRTADGRILFTEINARMGGCTHIHVLASRLFGPDYGDRYTLLTSNKLKAGPFPALLDHLAREGLLYKPGRREGAVILAEDTGQTGLVEYLVAATDRAAAHDLERRVLEVLECSRREAAAT